MDKVTTQSPWLDNHGWVKDFQEMELGNRAVNGSRAYGDQKWLNTAEPALMMSVNDGDYNNPNPKPDEQLYTSQVEDNGSWDMLTLEEALASLEHTDELPSIENFICILQKSRKRRNFKYARHIHMHILGHGMESHKALGNHLVPTLVECGLISDAQGVFNRLVHRNEHSWTSLIQGYNDSGDSQNAVNLLERMQENGVQPSRHTYVALLKACARLKCLKRGQELHADIIKEHFETDVFIGNTLVDMYVKCGSLSEAQKVFDTLLVRDVVSWTALLAGYTEHGLGHEALACLDRMQSEDVVLNDVTLVCSLKACGSIGKLDKGQELHAEIAKDGYEEDPYVGNALLDMYAKCGSLSESRFVFDNMATRDEVSWNALIAGYAEHGLGEEALSCLEQMKKEGKSPNAITFICSLKACGSIGALDRGKEIHAEIDRTGYKGDLLVGNTLLDMYCRCGSVLQAQTVFDKMPVRDVVSWTTLMAGYSEQGLADKALNCLTGMQKEGVHPDAVTYVWSLKSCSSIGSLYMGREIHAEIDRQGYGGDLAVGNSLVDMYAKCGSLEAAWEVFHKLPARTVVSWTALIAGYAEQGLGEEALKLLEQMQLEGVPPNAVTVVCSLKACSTIKAMYKGREIHCEVIREGFEWDRFVGNSLVDMYAKCGSLAEAQDVFNELPDRDVISWTALIAGFANGGFIEEALNRFKQMQLEGICAEAISWNALITGYAEKGETEKTFELYSQMNERGLLPNRVTFFSILKACANGATLDTGKKTHARIHSAKATEKALANSLIDMYSKLGSMVDAQQVFDAMHTRDHVTWTALMTGYARQKESRHVLRLFERMRQEGIQPDGVTFLIVLNACRLARLVDKGQKYFEAMTKEYSITPTTAHQDCMVDLLGEAGRVDEAVAMIL